MSNDRPATRWLIATPIAAGVNVALLAILAREPKPTPFEPTPPMIVTLERPRTEPPSHRRELPRAQRTDLGEPKEIMPPPPGLAPTEPPAPPPPEIPPAWRVDGGVWLDPEKRDNARRLHNLLDQLRYARACAGLSNETLRSDEKARCLEAKGAASRSAAPATAAPLSKPFTRDLPLDLTRRPKRGCLPRAAGATPSPGGREGIAAGVSCALAF